MTYQNVATLIDSIGLPFAYYQFTEDTAQPCPFICFYYPGDNDFIADNANYAAIRELTIELYTDEKDFSTEATVEGVLTAAGLVWTKMESYIDQEKMFMTTYETEVLITNGEQD